MELSKRILGMQASPIRRLVPYAEEAKRNGRSIYHLNIGQPDIKTPPGFFEAVRAYSRDVLAYGPSDGDPALIDAIIRYYRGYGMEFERRNVLITYGASEAIAHTLMAVCDPGDEVLIPEPFYANYKTFVESVSGVVVPITTKAEQGFHLPGREEIEQKITPRTRAMILCHPGNPTGTVFTRAEMEMVADLARTHGFFILADEVYREFVYDGLEYVSFGRLEGVDEHVVIMDAVSKRYSACGARVGCLVSRNTELVGQVLKLCQARTCVGAMDMAGAAALYDTPVSYLKEVNDEYTTRRNTVYRALKQIPGVVCEEPKGAFYVVAKLPVDDAEKFIIWMLGSFNVGGETVMMSPA
ncbi:MAG: aspartate aminotransferase, partial [Synergistetes bacterium HGW-Synergistetes-2]